MFHGFLDRLDQQPHDAAQVLQAALERRYAFEKCHGFCKEFGKE
jgi:hypothetical protein